MARGIRADRVWLDEAPTYAAAGPHGDAAHRAISAELVRLTLGGKPDRPELQVARSTRARHPELT